jgi:membrane-associated protease RseP (regulator of RpoE activity)
MKSILTFFALFFILSNVFAENLFKKNYQIQGDKNLKSQITSVETEIYRGWDKDTDNITMLEEGYDLMGFSSYVGVYTPPAEAVDFGKQIGADAALIYDRQINEANRATVIKKARENYKKKKLDSEGKIEEIVIQEEDLVDPNVKYDFYVSFWAKLPKPLFGTHLISFKEGDERNKDGGLFVVAVIKESAAFNAGIQRKDLILKINNIELSEPSDFIKELVANKGKEVEIEFKRNEETKKIKVQI